MPMEAHQLHGRWTFIAKTQTTTTHDVRLLPNGHIADSERWEGARWEYSNEILTIYDPRVPSPVFLTGVRHVNQDIFSGDFAAGESGVTKYTLSRPRPYPTIGCFFRTHFWNSEVERAYVKLRESWTGEVVIASDQTHPFAIPPNLPQLPHELRDFSKLGLEIYPNAARNLWHMGDYPLYSMLTSTDYDYFIMTEYDVVAHNINLDSLVERVIANRIDCAGSAFQEVNKDGYWYEQQNKWNEEECSISNLFCANKIYWFFFPFIIISRASVQYIFSRRIIASHLWRSGKIRTGLPFCETFVPSELISAGFQVANLSRYADFHVDLTIKAKTWREVDLSPPCLTHPVLSGSRLVQNIIHEAHRPRTPPTPSREWLLLQADRPMSDQERALLVEAAANTP